MTDRSNSGAGLPGRDELAERLAAMMATSAENGVPTVMAVGIDGYSDLVTTRGVEVAAEHDALGEIITRMGRIVRRDDVVGWLTPDTLGVIGVSLGPEVAGLVMDRLRSVFAMPIELRGAPVSMPCSIGVAFGESCEGAAGSADPTSGAEQLLSKALVEMDHDRRRRSRN